MSSYAYPRTVLYVHSSNDLYGADIILLQIAVGIDRRLFRPIFVIPSDVNGNLLSERLTELGIKFVKLPIAILRRRYLHPRYAATFLRNCVQGTLELRRLIRDENVCLIHGTTLAVIAAPLAAKVTGVPLLMHAHEILLRPAAVRKATHWLASATANRIVCVSEAVRQNILRDVPKMKNKVVVVRNGIIPVAPPQCSIIELRRRLGVPVEGLLVGMIGRISAWKGQDVFIKSSAICRDQGGDAFFVAIGGTFDNATEPIEALQRVIYRTKMEERFFLIDFRSDARDFLYAFDIFVLPSTLPDPFPTVVLEAMSTARAIIATGHGGALEMLENELSGLLVPPNDPMAMADAIMRLSRDVILRNRLGETAKVEMLRRFDLIGYLQKIEASYMEILSCSE